MSMEQQTETSSGEKRPQPEDRARAVSGMFGAIVNWYDPLNRILSLGLDQRWRRRLADAVLPGGRSFPDPSGEFKGMVLDLAAGTLDVGLALRKRYPGVRVPSLDFCLPMLKYGKRKLQGEDEKCIWPVAADALLLPLSDACVDGITMAFGIRNIAPREAAFAEMARVLVPGGRACILEFGSGQQKIWFGLYNLYLRRILPRIGFLSGNADAYTYLAESIMAFPSPKALAEELHQAGFARVYHVPLTSGIVCLHIAEKGKR